MKKMPQVVASYVFFGEEFISLSSRSMTFIQCPEQKAFWNNCKNLHNKIHSFIRILCVPVPFAFVYALPIVPPGSEIDS